MKTWLIDPGHGGTIGGVYQTAPNKMYDHGQGRIFHEGVFNREITNLVMRRANKAGLHIINLVPTELDVGLDERADIANIYARQYPNSVGISLHSNAGGGTGFEVFTSVGETSSDKYAELFVNEFADAFPYIRIRKDLADGDFDKEAHFYILKNTKCPWILPECLFYDNIRDYEILIDREFQKKYANMIVDFMKKA